MTWATVKASLLLETGRNDLSSNSRFELYANMAQQWLDTTILHMKSRSWYRVDIAAATIKVEIQDCWAIDEVWYVDSDGERALIKEVSDERIKSKYFKQVSDLTAGVPSVYAPIEVGLTPNQDDLTSENFTDEFTYGSEITKFGDHYAYNAILLMPPADAVYTIEILGYFYSKTLTTAGASTEKSYWTEVWPYFLIQATTLFIEDGMRNSEGFRDRLQGLSTSMEGIRKMQVMEMSGNVNQMKG